MPELKVFIEVCLSCRNKAFQQV